MVFKAGIEFDTVLAPENVLPENILPLSTSRPTFRWTPESSGVSVPNDAAAELERMWAEWVEARQQTAPARADWTPDELETIVGDYFDMLAAELRGEAYNKAEHRRALLKQLNRRSEASVEFKHRNISAVLAESGMPYIDGYKPASNYQDTLADAVEELFLAHTAWASRAEQVVPITPPTAERYGIEDILVSPPSPTARRGNGAHPKLGKAIDYAATHAANSHLGKAGEKFVVELEKRYLHERGRDDLAARVEHVSETQGDALGYDILSFDDHGNEKLIEVKTTNLGTRTPFYVSVNEVNVSCRESKRYWLYRLCRFSRSPRLFRVTGALAQTCLLQPAVFIAKVAGAGAI